MIVLFFGLHCLLRGVSRCFVMAVLTFLDLLAYMSPDQTSGFASLLCGPRPSELRSEVMYIDCPCSHLISRCQTCPRKRRPE